MQVTGPNGRAQEVTDDGFGQVEARSLRSIAQVAQSTGMAYSFASTFATGGANIVVALWKNALDGYDLVIDEIEVSSDTAGLVTIQSSTGTPAGPTAASAKPLNIGGPTGLQSQCYGGASVTGTTASAIHSYVRLAAAGRAVVQFHGALVVTPNTQIEVRAAQNGVVDAVIRAYYRRR